jgi:hypothetical protein
MRLIEIKKDAKEIMKIKNMHWFYFPTQLLIQ